MDWVTVGSDNHGVLARIESTGGHKFDGMGFSYMHTLAFVGVGLFELEDFL